MQSIKFWEAILGESGVVVTQAPGRSRASALVETDSDLIVVAERQPLLLNTLPLLVSQLRAELALAKLPPKRLTLALLVPSLTPKVKEAVKSIGIGAVDYAGNAWIKNKGLHVVVEGRREIRNVVGRPKDYFSGNAGKVLFFFAIHPAVRTSRIDLAKTLRIDPGQISRIVSELRTQQYLSEATDGRLELVPARHKELLDDLHQNFQPSGYFISAKFDTKAKAEKRVDALGKVLTNQGIPYAIDGRTALELYKKNEISVPMQAIVVGKLDQLREAKSLTFPAERPDVWFFVTQSPYLVEFARESNGLRVVPPEQAYINSWDFTQERLLALWGDRRLYRQPGIV